LLLCIRADANKDFLSNVVITFKNFALGLRKLKELNKYILTVSQLTRGQVHIDFNSNKNKTNYFSSGKMPLEAIELALREKQVVLVLYCDGII
jgi:hypothetical protein